MSYGVYFADLTEENDSLLLTLLRLKKEEGRLEQGEEELLAQMRGRAASGPAAGRATGRGPSAGGSKVSTREVQGT